MNACAHPYDRDYLIKRTVIALALEHKATCRDPDCTVQLVFLTTLLERAGIDWTEQEGRAFH